MRHVTIVATSEDQGSKSQLLARVAESALQEQGVSATLLDLREKYDAAALMAAVQEATHLIFAMPVYNFDVNARAKQVIEDLPGKALEGKTVGLICQAGGNRSYMSVLSFANSLMLDFRCWIVPRFVYATGGEFEGETPSADVIRRVEELVAMLLKGTS